MPTIRGALRHLVAPLANAALLLSLAAAVAGAQPPTPGEIVNGRVTVILYATLSEDPPIYQPVAQHWLVFYGANGDSTVRRTDDAGALTLWLPAGTYRLASRGSYTWRAQNWSWNIPLVVQPGMRIVQLTATNAVRGAGAAASGGAPLREPKDAGAAVGLSVLVPGGGQMYAGRTGKGFGLLAAAIASVVVGNQLGKDDYDACTADDCVNKGLVAGIATAAGIWIYSMVTAPRDVARWNRAHAFPSDAQLRPWVAPGRERTAVGLAMRW